MASGANVVETFKTGLVGLFGAVPWTPVYATYSATSSSAEVLDYYGQPLILDFDGFVAGFILWGNTSAGAGNLDFKIAGTTVFRPSASTADQMTAATNTNGDYSERDFVAGAAVTCTTNTANLKTGSILLFCIPT